MSSVEADVYVWCYALLVVHVKGEEDDSNSSLMKHAARPSFPDSFLHDFLCHVNNVRHVQ